MLQWERKRRQVLLEREVGFHGEIFVNEEHLRGI